MKTFSALDEHIRKLQQLRDLLADPEIAKFARNLLTQKPTTSSETAEPKRAPKRVGKKRGALPMAALAVIQASARKLAAKEVAHILDSQGFPFKASDKEVATSKALRLLADKHQVAAERSGPGKAAILYGPLNGTGSAQMTQ